MVCTSGSRSERRSGMIMSGQEDKTDQAVSAQRTAGRSMPKQPGKDYPGKITLLCNCQPDHSFSRNLIELPVNKGTLGQFIQQLLFLLVGPGAGFISVFFNQFAQGFDPLITLLPGGAGALQALLMPAQGLALLFDGGLHLRHEALIIEQPLPADPFPAALRPALGVFATVVLQITQSGRGLIKLLPAFAEHAGGLLLLIQCQIQYRRHAPYAAVTH